MDVIVLVGGEGTRLRPLTYDIPKQMLPVLDRTLVEHVVEWLARGGMRRAVLSLGYRPDAFIEAFPTDAIDGVELVYAVESEPLGTAGAVRFAAEKAGVEGRFLVLNGDVLTDLDIASLVEFHAAHEAEASIHLTPVVDPSAFGVVPTDAEGRVREFVEKPSAGTAPTNLINAGTYVLEPCVLDLIAAGRPVSIERETFPSLVAGGKLFAMASDDYWLDTGTPENYLQAQLDILHGLRTPASRPNAPEMATGAFVASGAVVDGVLSGVGYLGPGALVAAGAATADSVVGAGAKVLAGAQVSRSALLPGAVVGEGCVVTDSIVGTGTMLGSGCRLEAMTVLRGGQQVPAGTILRGARYPQ
ncbi:MAG: NDP-sugar synthase [Acidimicrobiales bacterium]|jgi:NDP-sugar pyrophosphorylase family protein